jgi:hypothetical protein
MDFSSETKTKCVLARWRLLLFDLIDLETAETKERTDERPETTKVLFKLLVGIAKLIIRFICPKENAFCFRKKPILKT